MSDWHSVGLGSGGLLNHSASLVASAETDSNTAPENKIKGKLSVHEQNLKEYQVISLWVSTHVNDRSRIAEVRLQQG